MEQGAVASRDRIVRSAAKLFLTRSYNSVGITDLCTAADVRKGSFYHFFPSKADLAKAVIDLHAAEFERRLDSGFAESASSTERLYAVAGAVARVQGAFEAKFGRIVGCPFGNLAAELSTTDDDLRVHVAAVFDRWEQRLLAACREAPLRIAPETLARMILAQIQGMILLAKVRKLPAAEIAANIRTLIHTSLEETE